MIQTIQKAGGILTSADLAGYKALVLPALRGTYRNRTYYVGHAPGGGPILMHLLNTLEGYKGFATGGRTGLAVHRFVEALKCSLMSRLTILLVNTDVSSQFSSLSVLALRLETLPTSTMPSGCRKL